jgi:hypothetical protein
VVNKIDIAIAVLVLFAFFRGWRLGLLAQVGSLAGRIGGIVLGALYAPKVSGLITHAWWRPIAAIALVWVASILGAFLGRRLGKRISEKVPDLYAKVNSSLGALLGLSGTLLLCWLVAGLLSVVTWGSIGNQVNHSVIVRSLQKYLPAPPAFEGRLQSLFNTVNIPNVFALLGDGNIGVAKVALAPTLQFQSSPAGVVPVVASGACHQANLGSGFFVSSTEVVTDAHVIAGQKLVRVNGAVAKVVAFDPQQDLAVLRVTQPNGAALPVASQLPKPGTPASVSGFATSTTNRSTSRGYFEGSVRAPGRSIYSGGLFLRQVELIAANVTPGKSGSPVLVNGQVVGVILAPSGVTKHLAFATSLAALRHDLQALRPSSRASTQSCLN